MTFVLMGDAPVEEVLPCPFCGQMPVLALTDAYPGELTWRLDGMLFDDILDDARKAFAYKHEKNHFSSSWFYVGCIDAFSLPANQKSKNATWCFVSPKIKVNSTCFDDPLDAIRLWNRRMTLDYEIANDLGTVRRAV